MDTFETSEFPDAASAGLGGGGSKKDQRTEKKRKKLLAEYELAKSNDEVKRPGVLLDSEFAKKIRVEPKEGTLLSPQEFKSLKKQLAERKKILTNRPRFNLQLVGVTASLSTKHDLRTPILMSDVQHLLLYAVCGHNVSFAPNRWCSPQKFNRLTHVVTLLVEGVTSHDFLMYEHLFPNLTKYFPNRVEVMAPIYYGTDVIKELACVPLTETQKKAILQKCGTMEAALSSKEVFKVFRTLFPITFSDADPKMELKPINDVILPTADVFPRTYLLLSLSLMLIEGFPLPFETVMTGKYSDFKFSKPKYKEVSVDSPMFAIDCEMCITEKNPQELTRISVINENLEVVYETLVKPKEKITNYLTKWSGITEALLAGITTTLQDVQEALSKLLPEDAILVGHSLNCDLQAMQIFHPYVIDTSCIFNLTGLRGRKSKLSLLAEQLLGELIQQEYGHNPTEDAITAMKLVKLKLLKGFRFGDSSLQEGPIVPECSLTSSLFSHTKKSSKTVAIVAPKIVLESYNSICGNGEESDGNVSFVPIPVSSNEEAVARLQDAAVTHNFALGHIDVSEEIKEGKDALEVIEIKERVLATLDDWCDKIFSHVSLNGLCVVVFSGPKNIPNNTSNNTTSTTKDNHNSVKQKSKKKRTRDSTSDNSTTVTNTDSTCTSENTDSQQNSSSTKETLHQSQPESKNINQRNMPRQNGVCFIRINTAR